MTINENGNKQVLVTGGTGFLGIHCILHLLNAGYSVKTTIRTRDRIPEVREMLANAGAHPGGRLIFVQADLTKDDNWADAMENCTYVLHVATPISLEIPKDENDVIAPAVEGTLRVLKAAQRAGVQRVVLTSSFAAIGYVDIAPGKVYTEENWTDTGNKHLSAYTKSKALAEKAAWQYIKAEGGVMEIAVINPVGIFGPLLGEDMSTSLQVLQKLFDGSMKRIPNINFGIVDVRDVADLQIRAMTDPKAAGERFLAIAGDTISLYDIALLLKNNTGDYGRKISTKKLPGWLVKISAFFGNAQAASILHQIDKVKHASNAKAKTVLGWSPRSNEEALISAADSMIRFNIIQPSCTKTIL